MSNSASFSVIYHAIGIYYRHWVHTALSARGNAQHPLRREVLNLSRFLGEIVAATTPQLRAQERELLKFLSAL